MGARSLATKRDAILKINVWMPNENMNIRTKNAVCARGRAICILMLRKLLHALKMKHNRDVNGQHMRDTVCRRADTLVSWRCHQIQMQRSEMDSRGHCILYMHFAPWADALAAVIALRPFSCVHNGQTDRRSKDQQPIWWKAKLRSQWFGRMRCSETARSNAP